MCTCPIQLADIRDSWQAGMVVVPADSRAVAHKFIVPNLLSHLAAMLERLFCEPTARLTIDYTYGDLFRAWSLDPADPNSQQQFELLLQQIDDKEEWGLPEFACW